MAGSFNQTFSVPVTVKPDRSASSPGHVSNITMCIDQELSEARGSEPANDYDAGKYSGEDE